MFKVGVLTIGSLFWEGRHCASPNSQLKARRESWRTERLDVERRAKVSVPIRYSRLSDTRGHCFTMVFDRNHPEAMGTAWVLPTQRPVSSEEQLIDEAIAMARSEGMAVLSEDDPPTCVSKWGMTALIPLTAQTLTARFRARWQKAVVSNDGVFATLANCCPMANSEAVLRPTDWPTFLDERAENELDVLLVALTAPAKTMPTAVEIADAIARDTTRLGLEYFEQNHRSEISTFQDDEILTELEKRGISLDL